MPCYTPPPSHAELEQKRLNELLDEIGDTTPKSSHGFLGPARPLSLDAMTRRLCEWSKANDPRTLSLEFQIWWRDHQAFDRKREATERAIAERDALREQALAKLTPEERKALRNG